MIRAELERLVLATVGDPAQAYDMLPMIAELLGEGGGDSSGKGDGEQTDPWALSLPELVLALVFVYSARGPSSQPGSSSAFREEDEFVVLDRVRSAVTAAASSLPTEGSLPGWEELALSCKRIAEPAAAERDAAQLSRWADMLTVSLQIKLSALSVARNSCPPWHDVVTGSNNYLPLIGQIARDIADGVANADDAPPQPPAAPTGKSCYVRTAKSAKRFGSQRPDTHASSFVAIAGLLRAKPSVASVAAAGLTGGAAGASGAARSLFTGGMSRLGFAQATPKPSDNEAVLLVVAGPVTPFELRRVAEVAEQTGKTLILAGTRLSSPGEFLADFLAA